MLPLISILVPVYRVEMFIRECAISLFEQTYENIEYIFVDDCSSDRSIEFLLQTIDEYPKRKKNVRIIFHEKNRGLSAARNTAIEAAKGEFIMHVDSDDTIDIHTVERCVDEVFKNKADVVVFGIRHIFIDKSFIEHNKIPNNIPDYVKSIIKRNCSVSIWGGLYHRLLYIDYGIRAIEGLNIGEDYVTKPRLIYNARKAISLDEPLYHYRNNKESYTNNFKEKHIDDLSFSLSILHDYFMNVSHSIDYNDALRVGTLKTKAILLIDCSLSGSDKVLFNKIKSIYPEYTTMNGLRIQDKCVLWLANHEFYNILYLFSYLGLKFKHLFR